LAFNVEIGMLDYPHHFSCWAVISFAGYAQSRLWAVPYSRSYIKSSIPYRCCTWMIVFRFLLFLVRGLYLFRRLSPIHSYASWIWNAHWHIIFELLCNLLSPFDIVIGTVLWTAEVCFVEWLDQVSLQHLFKIRISFIEWKRDWFVDQLCAEMHMQFGQFWIWLSPKSVDQTRVKICLMNTFSNNPKLRGVLPICFLIVQTLNGLDWLLQ